jgi:hypothetical protein
MVGGTGIGSETLAFVVHDPATVELPPMLLALVPMPAEHELVSLQLVGSVHAVVELYAPVALSQLSVFPDAL